MCQFNEGFILCTCVEKDTPVVHNKKSRRHKHNTAKGPQRRYRWMLKRYLRYEDSGMMGLCFMPTDNLGDGLSNEWVLLHLNTGHCFDFEYAPSENDTLQVRPETGGTEYLSYIYKNGIWVCGENDCFTAVEETIRTGNVEKRES